MKNLAKLFVLLFMFVPGQVFGDSTQEQDTKIQTNTDGIQESNEFIKGVAIASQESDTVILGASIDGDVVLGKRIEGNSTDIQTNSTDIQTNTDGIAMNSTGVKTNSGNINNNRSAINSNTQGIQNLNRRVDQLDTKLSSGIAMSMAMQPSPILPGKKGSVSFRNGYFNDQHAIAVSGATLLKENLSFDASLGIGVSEGDVGFSSGFTFNF